jgi:hypothetical protein
VLFISGFNLTIYFFYFSCLARILLPGGLIFPLAPAPALPVLPGPGFKKSSPEGLPGFF